MIEETDISELSTTEPSSIKLLSRDATVKTAWDNLSRDEISAVGVLNFAGTQATRDAAKKLVSNGSEAEMSFYCVSEPQPEKAITSFQEELSRDFHEVSQEAEKAGSMEISECLIDLLPHILEVVRRMVLLYDIDLIRYEDTEMCFLLKIEVNIPGACIKLHNDSIGVRFVTSMTGGGTVVADGYALNWKAWELCGGLLPLSIMKEEDWTDSIKKFNAGLCPGDRQWQFNDLDLLMMKGDVACEKPCIHRAPMSAGEDAVERLLVKLDFIPKADVDKYIAHLAATSEDEEE